MLPFTELTRTYGSPLYVYDGDRMEVQYNRLLSAFSVPSIRLNFACKALTNLNILKLFAQLGSGLDAVSPGEVKMGLAAGFAPEKILFTPSGVSFSELEEVIQLGVRITLDNFSVLEKFGKKFGGSVPACIRINPHVMGGGHVKISTGHKGSKFGISIAYLDQLVEHTERLGMNITGLHLHTGSDILDPEAFRKSADALFTVAMRFPSLEYLDFGSGFKVAYKPGDYATDIERLGEVISADFNDFCTRYGKPLTLIFEPGKFLVSEAGYFCVTVNAVKQTPVVTFAAVDSGLNHLIRPMFYDAYHHILNVSNPDGPLKKYSVVGYICETDTFASDRELPEVREGDCLVFRNAGAYCFSMSSNYNSRLRPAEVLLYKGKTHLIRRRETFEDLLGTQIACDL